MSRGPGHIMRDLEARLNSEWQPLVRLAAEIFKTDPPTAAQIESLRRAAHRLRQLERASVEMRGWHFQTGMGPIGEPAYRYKKVLCVRTPLTDEEIAEQKRRAAEIHAWLAGALSSR